MRISDWSSDVCSSDLNLVSNSAKYGRPETPITIRLDGSGTMIKLSVTDESEGIDPRHLPRLTERFYRVDSGRSRSMGGTGLGLAIVKHIVERHRGRMEIMSTPRSEEHTSELQSLMRTSFAV